MERNKLILKAAKHRDIPMIRCIFDQGRRFQQSLGFVQWLEGYPAEHILAQDIDEQRGFLINIGSETVGYVAIYLTGDSEYDRLPIMWKQAGDYAVVHRLVLSDASRGRHISPSVLAMIETYIMGRGLNIVRIDTGLGNIPMQALMNRCGYSNVGKYTFVWGDRYAYEKLLQADGNFTDSTPV